MTFSPEIVTKATTHMNEDHADGNLYIVRAFADPEAKSATMTTLDDKAGTWSYVAADGSEKTATVPWPAGPISERMQIRVQVVALYKTACEKLGVEVKPHPEN